MDWWAALRYLLSFTFQEQAEMDTEVDTILVSWDPVPGLPAPKPSGREVPLDELTDLHIHLNRTVSLKHEKLHYALTIPGSCIQVISDFMNFTSPHFIKVVRKWTKSEANGANLVSAVALPIVFQAVVDMVLLYL
jgi:hypothetical protein